MTLRRTIGLGGLVLYGTGTILGAGIFVVIGEVLGIAGPLAPFAYALAALVAIFTALSYSEIAARLPSAGGPIVYTAEAFGSPMLSGAVGWVLVIANIVSGATITTGFVTYLSSLVELPPWLATAGMIGVLGYLAIVGIKESALFMAISTTISIAALIVILWLTRDGFATWPTRLQETAGFADPGAVSALIAAAFLAVYSFIGFGDVAQTAEEVKDVRHTLPRAMWLTLALVFTLYAAISIALGGSGDLAAIAEAEAPLVYAATGGDGPLVLPLTLVSLVVIFDGALPQIIAAARLLMDMGRDRRAGVPSAMARIDARTRTPVIATLATLAAMLVLALFVPLGTLASWTSLAILLVFIAVNASLWRLKRRSQPEGVPNIWPLVPMLGVVVCSLTVLGQLALWLLDYAAG